MKTDQDVERLIEEKGEPADQFLSEQIGQGEQVENDTIRVADFEPFAKAYNFWYDICYRSRNKLLSKFCPWHSRVRGVFVGCVVPVKFLQQLEGQSFGLLSQWAKNHRVLYLTDQLATVARMALGLTRRP